MIERRQSPRTSCRFRCKIRHGGSEITGIVVDISTGGMAVRADAELHHGDFVEVDLDVPGRGTLTVEAVVWHVRRARLRDSGATVFVAGTMISKAPEEYLKLARGGRPKTTRATPSARKEPTPEPEAAPSTVPSLAPYRVQLRHRATPRTRLVSVDARSPDDAHRIATAELGSEWEILQVRRAGRA